MSSAEIDWSAVRRVLVIRLRSIGDTVLSTPSLIALKRFLPNARVDILLEDWVAPVLTGFDSVDEILTVGNSLASRAATAREIRRRRYDVVFNIHGGTTATFFVAASRARYRVGYQNYQYSFLYNRRLTSPFEFWKRDRAHSAEQQLALLGFVGVPVSDLPRSRLAVDPSAVETLRDKFQTSDAGPFAMLHPTAAFETKTWPIEYFAKVAEYFAVLGLRVVGVAAEHEREALDRLRSHASVPIDVFANLSLPEITALASKATIFVGNDSGIAHIAAAVQTPTVVVFGSSNRDHWRPWTDAPNEIVFSSLPCQPCPGHECLEFGEPRCIREVRPEAVIAAIERVLEKKKSGHEDRP